MCLLPAAGDMLKPVKAAAVAHLNPPGWSVSPAYHSTDAPAAGDMLKPVNSAAVAHLNPPGWSVSPAYALGGLTSAVKP